MKLDDKWIIVATTFSSFLDMQEKQIQAFKDMVNFLMDGEDNGKKVEAHEEVVACIRCARRKRDVAERKRKFKKSWID